MMTSIDTFPDSLRKLITGGKFSEMIFDKDAGPCVLFCRHSDRPHLPPNTAGATVSLTPAGMAKALQLGICLKELHIQAGSVLMCSPIARNIETLNQICVGADWTDHLNRIEFDKRIFGPGTIYDEVEIDNVVTSYAGFSSYEVANEILKGNEKRYHGVKPFQVGVQLIIEFIVEVLSRPSHEEINGLSIIVSHDLHVAYLLAKLFHYKQFTQETWPPFLDSILFQLLKGKNGNRLKAVYGDQVSEIDM